MASSPEPNPAKGCVPRSCRPSAKRPCAMSLETEIKSGHLQRGRFRYFSVAPGRLEFAVELRKLLLAEKPPLIAVELAGFLADAYRRALARLPQMSVILYTDESNDQDRAVYV